MPQDFLTQWMHDDSVWASVLEHGFNRGVSRSILIKFSEFSYRESVLTDIENGMYKILPPRKVSIPKDTNSFRDILVNSNHDRLLLAAIYKAYYGKYHHLIHSNCVSYQAGMGVNRIVRNANTQIQSLREKFGDRLIGCKVDISKYFDTVPREVLNNLLSQLSMGSAYDKLLWDYYNDDRIEVNKEIVPHYKSLSQGCAMSALLANFVLYQLDRRLSETSLFYIRYSDDILFFTDDLTPCLNILVQELENVGLSLNLKKVFAFTDDFDFLGVRFRDNKLLLSKKSLDLVKSDIRHLTKRSAESRGSRAVLKQTINRINQRLYQLRFRGVIGGKKQFSWADYMFSVCDEEAFRELDFFIKDHLRAMYTGRWNTVHNIHKVSNDMLREAGYHSMIQMYKLYHMDKDVYIAELRRFRDV